MSTTTADRLRAARALIEDPHCWIQGEADDGKGRYCMLGAINASGPRVQDQCKLMAVDIMRLTLQTTMGIVRWNDAPERTHAEVVDAFDRAIARAETVDAFITRADRWERR